MMKAILLTLAVSALAAPAHAQTASVSATVDGVTKSLALNLKPRSVVTLTLAGGTVAAGQAVTLDLSMASTRMQPASLQVDLTFQAADVASVTVAEGPAATAAGKGWQCTQSAGKAACLLFSVSPATIANGVIGKVTVTTKGAAAASTTVGMLNFVVSNKFGGGMASAIAPGGGVLTVSQLFGFACASPDIEPDEQVICTATLSGPAPAGGKSVTYAVSDATKLEIAPASAPIAAGAAAAAVTVTGK